MGRPLLYPVPLSVATIRNASASNLVGKASFTYQERGMRVGGWVRSRLEVRTVLGIILAAPVLVTAAIGMEALVRARLGPAGRVCGTPAAR